MSEGLEYFGNLKYLESEIENSDRFQEFPDYGEFARRDVHLDISK